MRVAKLIVPMSMVCRPTSFDDIAAFLYRDPFPNASIIGAIERRLPALTDVWVSTTGNREIEGVLVLAPGAAEERGVGIEAVTATAASELLEVLPAGDELSFGLHRPLVVDALRKTLQVRPGPTMAAFRCGASSFRPDPRGVGRELTAADHRLVLRSRDDHFQTTFEDAVHERCTSDGLRVHTFGVAAGSRLAARCLTTWGEHGIDRHIGTVWSVYTEPSYRNQGLGRAAVSAATAAILATGRVARYFAYTDNAASIRICRALGFEHDHEIYYFRGRGVRR